MRRAALLLARSPASKVVAEKMEPLPETSSVLLLLAGPAPTYTDAPAAATEPLLVTKRLLL